MLPMHARHFLSGRARPSSSAIQSNNCFITRPSRKSFVASIALACSGGKSVSRGGIYLFFLPDSFRDVLSLSIYHCGQQSQPLRYAKRSLCPRNAGKYALARKSLALPPPLCPP